MKCTKSLRLTSGIDLVSGVAVVRRNAVYGQIGTPKSGKNREIPLCDSVVKALKSHRHLRGELVFSEDRGQLMHTKLVYRLLKRSCQKAGLRNIAWHVLRHTFASHLAMKGVPMRVIQELLGHASIEMTMKYAHLSPSVTREYVQMLDQKGNGRAMKLSSL